MVAPWAAMSQDNYPSTSEDIVFLNTPGFVTAIWGLISPLIGEQTQVRVTNPNPNPNPNPHPKPNPKPNPNPNPIPNPNQSKIRFASAGASAVGESQPPSTPGAR